MPKIHCPFHEDENASMEVYPDGRGFCFVCWRGADLHKIQNIGEIPEVEEKEPEDIPAAVERIRRLPVRLIRGLDLHSNDRGYFILWPNGEYYKFRSYAGQPRYLAPRGHGQPLLFCSRQSNSRGIIIVEGEINALSVAKVAVEHGYDVVSPGPAGNFTSYMGQLVAVAKQYPKILIWTDQDSAGIKALWAIAPRLIANEQKISMMNSESDANDLLINEGPGGLLEALKPFMKGN